MSGANVLRKAGKVDQSGMDNNTEDEAKEIIFFYDKVLTGEVRMRNESMAKRVLPPYKPRDTPATIVFKLYSQFDNQFIEILRERVNNGNSDA